MPGKSQDEPQICYAGGKHWFVVRTNIQCERRAQLGLDALGFRTFCPKLKKWVRHARVKSVVERPLIARHFFIEVDPAMDGFGAIRATDGVESLLGVCGTPMVVPRRFVEEFIARQLQGEWDYASKDEEGNERPLTIGCKVAIVSGEYDDMFGVIQNMKTKNGRFMVKILESAILARFSTAELRAA